MLVQLRLKRSRLSMLNIAIGARKAGRYRVEDAPRTDGVVARTGVVAGTTTGVVAGGRHRATLVR